MLYRYRLSLTILYLLINFSLNAQNKDSIAVINSTTNFVTSFNNFDWPTFRRSFTDDATIFYPFWNQAKRLRGRQDIEVAWLAIFPEFADPQNARKLQISPRDIHIQLYRKTAIVTFHLGDGVSTLSRRTLVLVKDKRDWKIAHLHASSVKENQN